MSPWNISFRAYLGHLPECTILSSCRMLNCVCTTPASRILFFNYYYYCFFFFLRKSYSRTAEGAAEIWLALSQSHFFQKEGENIFLIICLQLPFPMYLQKGNGLTVCELLWCIGWRFLYPMFIDLQSILWILPEWCLITTLCDVSSPDAGIFFFSILLSADSWFRSIFLSLSGKACLGSRELLECSSSWSSRTVQSTSVFLTYCIKMNDFPRILQFQIWEEPTCAFVYVCLLSC